MSAAAGGHMTLTLHPGIALGLRTSGPTLKQGLVASVCGAALAVVRLQPHPHACGDGAMRRSAANKAACPIRG
jgi:hypothetical protein